MPSLLPVHVLIKNKKSPLIHATLAQAAYRRELKSVLRPKIYRRLMHFSNLRLRETSKLPMHLYSMHITIP